MTKLLRLFSVLAVLGFVFASAQPADAHGRHNRHHWGHHHMMKFKHCHLMNKQVRVRHGWTWRHVRVCHR